MQAKVCVTGCGGYIGSVLCETLLRHGYTVCGIDNLMYRQSAAIISLMRHRSFEFHQIDITKTLSWIKTAARSDVIIHLAALVGAPLCDKKEKLATETNFRAVKDLVECLSKQLLIFPNTNSGYGSHPTMCSESTELRPLSLYAKTKCDAENVVKSYKHSIIFRLATVFGLSPRMRLDLMLNDFVYQCIFNKKLEIFEPGFFRNFVEINDVVDAFIFGMNHSFRMQGQIYNLGQASMNMTKGHLAKRLCSLTGAEYSEKEGSDPDRRNYHVSNFKLYAEGFVPVHDLHNSIKTMIAWMKTLPENKRHRNEVTRLMRNA